MLTSTKDRRFQIIRLFFFLAGFNFTPAIAQTDSLPMHAGNFKPTDESLTGYQYPEWFRNAKFGIWAHWGPQAVPRQGDWYARNMYLGPYVDKEGKEHEGSAQYRYHLAHYGHPSEFGYKDIIPLWKAERWDPEELMKLYKRVGARYFVSMGTHHDNFFLWNSYLNDWNAVNMGPKKDVVGLWQAAAKKNGLYFGVSEHLAASYTWFQPAHGADQLGDKKGVPYDGQDPRFWQLYHKPTSPGDDQWYTNNPKFQRDWYNCISELIDTYHPDLLYSDGAMPFGNEVGRSLIASYYNEAATGNPDGVVYTCKQSSDGKWVQDYERGAADTIRAYPWQTDTSIGDWYYRTGQTYMSADEIVKMLIDIVSKNGNLLLNVVQTPEGDLEADVLNILEEIAAWMDINSSAIYDTRPWKIYGEGPSLKKPQESSVFQHIADAVKDVRKYQPGDLRFTAKDNKLFVFCMEPATTDLQIESLGLSAKTTAKVKSIRLLGSEERVKWSQKKKSLSIKTSKANLPLNCAVYEITLD